MPIVCENSFGEYIYLFEKEPDCDYSVGYVLGLSRKYYYDEGGNCNYPHSQINNIVKTFLHSDNFSPFGSFVSSLLPNKFYLVIKSNLDFLLISYSEIFNKIVSIPLSYLYNRDYFNISFESLKQELLEEDIISYTDKSSFGRFKLITEVDNSRINDFINYLCGFNIGIFPYEGFYAVCEKMNGGIYRRLSNELWEDKFYAHNCFISNSFTYYQES